MQRRLTMAMAALVATALVLAGTVTFGATVHAARVDNRSQLITEARGLARVLKTETIRVRPRQPTVALRSLIRALVAPLRLEDAVVLALRTSGALFDPATPRRAPMLPKGVTVNDLEIPNLLALQTVSGQHGGQVYVAAPSSTTVRVGGRDVEIIAVVVITRRSPTGLAAAGPWFVGAALIILGLTVVVADRLGRRFLAPLRAAQATTVRVAAGDLDARVDVGAGVDPELVELGASVNTMAESLSRARQSQRMFLLSVSHDLRTPLTSIRGFAEAIEDGVTPDASRAAATIVAESRRLERLVGDLLDLAKLEARQFVLHPEVVDLGQVVEVTAAGFEPLAAQLGLRLVVEHPAPGPVIELDADRVAQVIANLVENALSFARTEVRIGVVDLGPDSVVWVDDDGPGILPDDLRRVFERLYTSRPESTRVAGSGIGLAIVAELISAMGGAVHAESPLFVGRGGTRMVVRLRSPVRI